MLPTDVSAGFWLHRYRINSNLTAQARENMVDEAHARCAEVTEAPESFDTGHRFAEYGGDHEKVLVRLRKVIDKIAALEIAKSQAATANGAAAEANATTASQKVDIARPTESSPTFATHTGTTRHHVSPPKNKSDDFDINFAKIRF